jgi:hypothetical protein
MTTQKNKTKSTEVITFEDLGNKLTQTLNEVTSPDTDIKNTSKQFKTAMMAVMLTKEDGVTIKELADKLGWKENSVRGDMSVLASRSEPHLLPKRRTVFATTDCLPSHPRLMKRPKQSSNKKGAVNCRTFSFSFFKPYSTSNHSIQVISRWS